MKTILFLKPFFFSNCRAIGGGRGKGVKRERRRKFHDRQISTAVTLFFLSRSTKATQDCFSRRGNKLQGKRIMQLSLKDYWINVAPYQIMDVLDKLCKIHQINNEFHL